MQLRLSEAVSAFASQIDVHRRLVFGAAFRVLGDARRADDVTERAFVELFETGLSRVGPTVPHWLLETVLREAHAVARGMPAAASAASDGSDDATFTEDVQGARRWTRSGARRALERLSARERPSRG